MNKNLRLLCILLFFVFFNSKVNAQNITYTFVDPCTQDVSYFSIPIQGTTTVVFLNHQQTFTAQDVSSGAFANWINQVYSDYRIVVPCSVQSTNVVRNLISTQILSNTIGNLIGSITSQVGSETSSNDAASKGKTESDKKKKTDNSTSNTNNTTTSNTNNSTENNQNSQSGTQNNQNSPVVSENSQSQGQSTTDVQSSNTSNSQGQNTSDNQSDGGEINGTMAMNVDSKNDKGGSSNGKSSSKGNPMIISSDYTNAQNLDKSFTGIINIGTSKSSLTGKSSYGLTSMTWFNFKQFAISARYTTIHFSKNGKLKLIHNFNLTGLYTYGNYMGFVGYSAILNANKWGVTGANISVSTTKISEDQNTFISPAITAFYTRPTRVNKRLTLSPELYVISTPLVYSSAEKTTVKDRTFSAFIGTGVDYQITKKFKVNMNYKANMSTNPDFPILNFFLIGSKINL